MQQKVKLMQQATKEKKDKLIAEEKAKQDAKAKELADKVKKD